MEVYVPGIEETWDEFPVIKTLLILISRFIWPYPPTTLRVKLWSWIILCKITVYTISNSIQVN